MAKKFLDRADIVAVLEEVRGKGMAEGVAGRTFRDARLPNGAGDRPLDRRLVEMVATHLTGGSVAIALAGREDILPPPVAGGLGILPRERSRQRGAAAAGGEVAVVKGVNRGKMPAKGDHG